MNQSIAVIGLGYVGLPLALTFTRAGYKVTGIDLDLRKIRAIREGESYLPDIQDDALQSAIYSEKFIATNDFKTITKVDAVVICVPTPLDERRIPDLSYLVNVGTSINKYIRPGHLIILESSTYPGTTKEILKPLLEQGGLTAGKDFSLGYSPERIDPGNHQFPFQTVPKIISGVTANCVQKVHELYGTVFDQVVPVSSTEAAELAKLLENSYRFVNISFINEFATLCDHMKIDAWEVIEAAGSKPFGFAKFYPGPGIGGHCIPVDPLYLQWKVGQSGLKSLFIETSAAINHSMPAYIATQLKEQLPAATLKGARILVIGITYKKDVNDIRESSAMELLQLLQQEGCELNYHDPFVSEITLNGSIYHSIELSENNLAQTDGVVIATEHSELPIHRIIQHASLVYDTRNLTKGLSGNAKIVRLGGGN